MPKTLFDWVLIIFCFSVVGLFCMCTIGSALHENEQIQKCKEKNGKYVEGVCLRPDQLIPLD